MLKTKNFKKIAVRFLTVIAVVIMMPFLTTCVTLLGLLPEPVITLRSVELTKISLTGVEVLAKINIDNRTALDIPVPDFDWELSINENSFVKGEINSGGTMRSRQVNVVDIPVTLSFVEIFNTFRSLKGSQSAGFGIAVDVKLELPVIGLRTWNFFREGTLPILQLPKISLPKMNIESIDFTKLQLSFSVNVENNNPFDLPSPQIAYDFLVNNNNYLKGINISPAPLVAGAVTAVAIGLTVEYADLFRLFADLFTTGEAPSLFKMDGDFGLPGFEGEGFQSDILGSIPLLRAPVISFRGVSLRNISLTSIDFELTWEIENNNNFALNINELYYDFTLNNSRLSSGRVTSAPAIRANSRTTVPFVFSVNALSMVREIADIVARGTSVSYICNGNINLGAALQGVPPIQVPFNFSDNTRLTR
ncbi:MAG: LEA type 2 family protein [Treponema sp.]|nr:LEA type 2 family protein [Treponema sp.]